MEKVNTQGTPEGTDTGAETGKELENKTPPVVSEPPKPEGNQPPIKSGEGGDDEDPAIRLEKVLQEKDILEKRFKDAERKITELGTERSSTRKQFEQLSNALLDVRQQLAQATKKPLPSTKEFIERINKEGVAPILELIKDSQSEVVSRYDQELSARDEANMKLELELTKMQMSADAENYPDFNSLWPEMQKLARDPNTPVNFEAGVGPSLKALYKLVRSDHSRDAILEAERKAKEEAEAKLAKEANSTVATGGKKGSGAGISEGEMRKMDTKKLRDLVQSMHGVADRD